MTDPVILYMSIMGAIVAAGGLFVAYMAHRQRLEEEAEEADRAAGTAAE